LLLILVGPPLEADYCAQIEAFIASHSLQNHVRLAGYADVPWVYYKASDIMVFASHEEGFGTVVIEAMAHGLPVVARRLPGVNDVFVQNGISGYLFDRPDDFLSSTSALLQNAEQRHAMGEAGRAFVIAHFDIARIAAQYLTLYGFSPESDGA
jgi:glycosyltransferase involved in cell wall biosynthesis